MMFRQTGDSFCKTGILLVKKGDSFSKKGNSYSENKILLVKTKFLFLFYKACSEYDDEIECHNDVLASITVF